MTLAEWAVSLGFYTQEETEADEFYTAETQSEPVPLLAWWPAIGGEIQSDVVRATTITDPLHRYLHRCIAYSITGRDQSTEQVTLLDMFFLRQLLTPRRVNLAHCMASYFLSIHQGKMDSPIVCGAYVTVLASRLGLFTDEVVVGQTQSATPKTLGKSTVVAMGIARQIGSQFRWTFDKGVTIWHPPVQGHPPVQQPPPEGAHPPPPPPPPPPQPRTIIRQIPPTAEYMAESLHLLREMHAMHAWSMDFLYDWGVAQGMTPAERPVLVPFVPQPAMPGDAGQRVVDDAESAMGDESDHTPPF